MAIQMGTYTGMHRAKQIYKKRTPDDIICL